MKNLFLIFLTFPTAAKTSKFSGFWSGKRLKLDLVFLFIIATPPYWRPFLAAISLFLMIESRQYWLLRSSNNRILSEFDWNQVSVRMQIDKSFSSTQSASEVILGPSDRALAFIMLNLFLFSSRLFPLVRFAEAFEFSEVLSS